MRAGRDVHHDEFAARVREGFAGVRADQRVLIPEHVNRGRTVVDVVVRIGVEDGETERLRIAGIGDVDEADRAPNTVRVDERLAVGRRGDDLRDRLVGSVLSVVEIVGERADALETLLARWDAEV